MDCSAYAKNWGVSVSLVGKVEQTECKLLPWLCVRKHYCPLLGGIRPVRLFHPAAHAAAAPECKAGGPLLQQCWQRCSHEESWAAGCPCAKALVSKDAGWEQRSHGITGVAHQPDTMLWSSSSDRFQLLGWIVTSKMQLLQVFFPSSGIVPLHHLLCNREQKNGWADLAPALLQVGSYVSCCMAVLSSAENTVSETFTVKASKPVLLGQGAPWTKLPPPLWSVLLENLSLSCKGCY